MMGSGSAVCDKTSMGLATRNKIAIVRRMPRVSHTAAGFERTIVAREPGAGDWERISRHLEVSPHASSYRKTPDTDQWPLGVSWWNGDKRQGGCREPRLPGPIARWW